MRCASLPDANLNDFPCVVCSVAHTVPFRRGESARLPWMLLGVHSARLDVGTRDLELDEALGLNCAWYADILLTLTEG